LLIIVTVDDTLMIGILHEDEGFMLGFGDELET